MGSLLGFRPPHFSEEEAWLPAWLQHSTIKASSQAVECLSGQELEKIGLLQQSISTLENRNSSGDGTYKSLHLYLSGDDSSPMIFPSCSSNQCKFPARQFTHKYSHQTYKHEVQLHLHLSSNDESQHSLNPTLSRSQADISEFNQQKGNLGIKCPNFSSIREQKEVNPKADISDAIELAVAASEALTIHEALKDELTTSSVLEAAIQVKKARLENFKENLSSCSIDETNEVDSDYLSDLDYLTMTDAYEDVGLTLTCHDDLSGYVSISHVNDSFASEINTSNAKHKSNERGGPEVDSGSISVKQFEQVNNVKLSLKGSVLEASDPVFSSSVEQTDFCATEVGLQREGFLNRNLTSSQTVLRSNEREDTLTNLVLDRFQSRWFGGWTAKNETSAPTVTKDKYIRNVPELFANDTSSLSESADIVPDMSSCAQRCDPNKTVSQSCVASQCVYEKAINNGDLISDDVVVSPTGSSMDPLCSVVPCSYTSDSDVFQNSKHLMNHSGPTVQPILDNLEVNVESSPTIRRQLASLKTYSMLYPRCGEYLDKEHKRSRSSSFEHNLTAKADTGLTSQREVRNLHALVPRRKRVRFLETKVSYPQVKEFQKPPQARLKDPLVANKIIQRLTRSKSTPHVVKKPRDGDDKMLFQDLKFLLTGFSVKKHKQIKILIQKNGGVVFDDIPSPPTSRRKRCSKLPLILCPKKLLTTKFLYGCAVNADIIKVTWLFDSVNEGLVLPHHKYKVLNNYATENRDRFIFDDTAIMLHGKPDFCSKMAKVIKHGGGLVFKTLHWLGKSVDSKKASAGVIVVEDENGISRHLKQCALEQKVPTMSFNWVINSLYAGRLLPSPQVKLPGNLVHVEMSEEI